MPNMASSSTPPSSDATRAPTHWIAVEQAHHVASKTFDLMVPELVLPTGRLTALIGANGSGKSTLLGVITGVRKTLSGQVHLGGQSVDAVPLQARLQLGVQLQDAGLNPQYSVRQIVALHQAAYPNSSPAVFAHFGVPELASRRFSQLSSGQRQRLQLAMALAHRPSMALFDEPTSNLDPLYEQRFVESLQQARDQDPQFSALFVTHSAGVVEACDDVVVMVNGRVEEHAEKNGLVQRLFGQLGARFEGPASVLDRIEVALRAEPEVRQVYRKPERLTVYGSQALLAVAQTNSSEAGLSLFSVWKTGAADILESFKND